ncbi:cobalamin-dependent protein, partial [bacterium]|nr:cobalamin-dependent protein [bacterium]
MNDIMLIYPPYTWEHTSPPLGLAYIAAILRNSGYAVRVLDMNPTHIDLEQLENELRADEPKIVGISAMTNQANATVEIAERVKMVDDSIKVIVGGSHPTALPDEMLENTAIDFVCIGEGEYTINEHVRSLLNGDKTFDSISGLAYRDEEGKVVQTSPRPFISDLDSLPFPAWDLLPLYKYHVAHAGLRGSLTFALLSSRGCPYRCIFCSSSLTMGRKFRMRSAENIFAEIQMLYNRFGMRQFDFVDDTITV